MLSLKAENVYDVAEPLHLCSQLIGLTSFTIKRKNQEIKASVALYNYSCLIVSTVFTALFTSMFILNNEYMWKINRAYISEVFEKSIFCGLISFFLCLIPTNLWLFASRECIAHTLTLLVEVDDELQRMKVPINFRKHKKVILFFVYLTTTATALSTIYVIFIGKDKNMIAMDVSLLISMNYCMAWNIFVIFHFTFIMCAVKLRYENINSYLNANFLSPKVAINKNGNEILNKIASLHDKLVDVTNCINRCYGFPVSFLLFSFWNYYIFFNFQRPSSNWRKFSEIVFNFSANKRYLCASMHIVGGLFTVQSFIATHISDISRKKRFDS